MPELRDHVQVDAVVELTQALVEVDTRNGIQLFLNPHLAFHFDVRFYAIDPGTPELGLPGSPRTTLLIAGVGISLK